MKNWRINIVFIFFVIFSAAILSRLFFLQISQGDFYKALSQGLHISFSESEDIRGEIFLSNKEPLAINLDWPFVFAQSKKIKNAEKTVNILSQILDLDKNFILEKIEKDNSYSVIKRKLSQKEAELLEEQSLEGIFVGREKGRYYPQESLAAQVVGFLGAEGKGQYGLEQAYEDSLRRENNFLEEQKGSDLILTIDYNIQFEAEKLLQGAKEDLKIEGGQIIVIEPNSGKILTLAHLSNFNPNHYEKYALEGNLKVFKNKTTQELFEPGSVFKTMTMAAALEENKIFPQTTYIDKGFVKVDGFTINNYDNRIHGQQTMTSVLEKSINTGAVFIQKELGQNLFLKYVEKFGFLEPTGIDIQEIYSWNKEVKSGREINLATASFGQGIEMTPIQLIRAYSAVANGGRLINPYLVEKVINQNSHLEDKTKRIEERIISSKTASQITAMLVSVVENGFAKGAKIPGYFIAGKTGTAQVSFGALGIDKKGYSENTIQTFIGFTPAFNPKFLVLIKLDNPQTKTAEYSAVPLFRKLAEYIIQQYQIPPDYEQKN